MTKRLYLFVLAIALPLLSRAQTPWFQSGQSAVEIQVKIDGLYVLTGAQQSFANFSGTPLDRLKLFHNGREAALRIVDGDNSGTWTSADSLWFFGVTNRGEAEAGYQQREGYRNPWSPFYGKAGRYFLLVDAAGNGLRMGQTSAGSAQTQTDWTAELVLAPRVEYSYGNGNIIFNYGKIHQSFQGIGEGWSSAARNAATTFVIPNPYTVRNAGGKIVAWVNGRNGVPHRAILNLGTTRVLQTDFANYERKIDSATFTSAGLGSAINLTLAPGLAGEYLSLMLARLQLPVQATVVDRPVTLTAVVQRSRVKLPNTVGSGLYLDVADPFQPKVLRRDGNEYLADADSGRTGRCSIWLQRQAFRLGDTALSVRTLNAPQSLQTGSLLILTNRRLADTAQMYADYRSSIQGGSHSVQLMKVEDIYDRYANGYPVSDAIRLFLRDEINQARKPKALLLMGKGLQHSAFFADSILREDLVPTWGVPASDAWFTTTDTGGFYNKIPTGRLAARKGRDVLNYLAKVRAQESNPEQLWRKNAYHLSGGRSEGEIDSFRQVIQTFSSLFRNSLVAGTAYEYSKQSASVIEAVNIRDKINGGLSVLNLFGHSAATTTDIDIGLASDVSQGYDNLGRCPLIIVNGCFSGNVFERASNSLNENWVLTPGRGAIAFSGTMDEGLPNLLTKHTGSLYQYQFQDTNTAHRPLGEIYQTVAKNYVTVYSNDLDSVMVSQTILHGDPLVRLFPFQKPDFTYNGADSRLVDQDVSAFEKSFALRLRIENRGQYRAGDSLSIIGKITNASGLPIYGAPIRIPAMRRDTMVDYRITGGFELDNSSTLEVILDYLNQVAEESEENNTLTISLGRFESGVTFLSPTRDAVVSSRDLKLVYRNLASEAGSSVQVQIDTTRQFNSALRIDQTGGAGLTQASVNLPQVADSTVYYLRYRTTANGQSQPWRSFAFTHIAGQEGWSQSTGFQYADNNVEGYTVDTARIRRAFSLQDKFVTVRLRTVGSGLQNTAANTGIDINGIPFFNGTQSSCLGMGHQIYTLRLNPNTLKPEVWDYGVPNRDQFWLYSCGRSPAAINYVAASEPRTAGFNRLVLLMVGSGSTNPVVGHYFFSMSTGQHDYSRWDTTTFQVMTFEDINPGPFRRATVGSPMIMAGRRLIGPTGAFTQGMSMFSTPGDTAAPVRQKIDKTFNIQSTPTEGNLTSNLIGPGISFERASIRTSRAAGLNDSALFTVRAYRDFSDTGSIVYRGNPKTLDLRPLTQGYRYIRLSFSGANRGDSTTFLEGWRVLYQPYPEGVALSAQATPSADAGDSLIVTGKYHNSLGVVANPLPTALYIRNNAGVLLDTLYGMAVKPANSDTSYVRFAWKSELNSPDTIQFEIAFNYRELPERNYLNNSAFARSVLRKDTATYSGYFEIDGLIPQDGQQVTSSPQIAYRLNRDFTGRNLALLFGPSCDTCSILAAEGFTLLGNTAYYNPTDLKPGMYEVRATVTDKYRLLVPQRIARFEVVNKDSLALFRAWPNPANQSVTFTYQCAAANYGGDVSLSVVNAYGEQVYAGTTQHNGLIAGNVKWDLRQGGELLQPGVYLAQLRITVNAADGTPKNVLAGTARLVVVR